MDFACYLIILYNLFLFTLSCPNSYCHQDNILFKQAAIIFSLTLLFWLTKRGHISSERSFQLSHVSLFGHFIRSWLREKSYNCYTALLFHWRNKEWRSLRNNEKILLPGSYLVLKFCTEIISRSWTTKSLSKVT